MPRPRDPSGKHITMALRVTDEKAAEIDAMRGTITRAEWLAQVVESRLAGEAVNMILDEDLLADVQVKARSRGETVDDVVAWAFIQYLKGTVAPPPRSRPSSPGPPRLIGRCSHPGTRYIGGFCKQCDHLVKLGGEWA